ncbi:MAG TPA: NDP-sugar synthase [Acidimicrobiales bacterium]
MRAIVLVGGLGTRLHPLTLTVPKQMLPIGNRPMIEEVVGHLARHGIDDVVLSLGYKPDVFIASYPGGVCAGARLHYAVEPERLDTAGAIRYAAVAAGVREPVLVVNGDVLTDLDVGALVAFHRSTGARATIALTPVEDPSAFGVVPTDEAGRVVAFIEKPPRDEAPTNLINAGTYVLEPEVVSRIPEGRMVSIEREVFPALADEGVLYAMSSTAYWLDTGTPAQYLQAHLDLLDGRRGPAPDPLDAAAEVDRTARVERSFLAAGCQVAADAEVVESVLLHGATVGKGAAVRRSILGPGADVGAGAVVEALSVLGAGVEVAPGTHVAGERIPEREPGS